MLWAKLDHFKCSGCRSCEVVCSLAKFSENNPRKAALRVYSKFPAPGVYTVKFCTQCGKCAEVCPEGAIEKKGQIYRINSELCTGCLACVAACPEEVIFTNPDSNIPIKCDWCGECMKACSRQVIRLKQEREEAKA